MVRDSPPPTNNATLNNLLHDHVFAQQQVPAVASTKSRVLMLRNSVRDTRRCGERLRPKENIMPPMLTADDQPSKRGSYTQSRTKQCLDMKKYIRKTTNEGYLEGNRERGSGRRGMTNEAMSRSGSRNIRSESRNSA
jgi:hypothetical protein